MAYQTLAVRGTDLKELLMGQEIHMVGAAARHHINGIYRVRATTPMEGSDLREGYFRADMIEDNLHHFVVIRPGQFVQLWLKK